jgi:hypothetical protein
MLLAAPVFDATDLQGSPDDMIASAIEAVAMAYQATQTTGALHLANLAAMGSALLVLKSCYEKSEFPSDLKKKKNRSIAGCIFFFLSLYSLRVICTSSQSTVPEAGGCRGAPRTCPSPTKKLNFE